MKIPFKRLGDISRVAFICVIIPAIIFYFYHLISKIDLRQISELRVNPLLALISIILFALGIYNKGLVLSCELADISKKDAFRIMSVGEAINMVVPFRLGDSTKSNMLPREYSFWKKTYIMYIPKLFDIIVLIIFCLLSIFFYNSLENEVGLDFMFYSGIVLGLIVIAFTVAQFFPKTKEKTAEFIKEDLGGVSKHIFTSWLFIYASIVIALFSLNMPADVAFRGALGVIVATNISMLVPGTPGGIGYFEALTTLALSDLINQSYALGAALLIHLIQYAALLPLGFFMFFFGKKLKKTSCK
ncbi:MAG: lysylphosphatidylglycerol synthase transmembrane domain-containing protein [Bacillota bacterium]|nr:lysylphosphatidylglycerol synthase transmembrane domain-containing protein [Bacillota bacterium]